MDEYKYNLREKSYKCFAFYVGIYLIIVPIFYSGFVSMFKEADNYFIQTILLCIGYGLLCGILIFILRRYIFDDIKSTKNNLWICLAIIVSSYFFIWGGEQLCKLFYGLFGRDLTSDNQETIIKCINSSSTLMTISTCLFAPIVEELIFRKCFFSLFKNDILALFVSGIVFALIHVIGSMDFINILPYLLTGFLLGTFYVLSRKNIFVTICAHIIANTVAFVIILQGM